MTRLPGMVILALLAYGLVVDCGKPGWIATPHRAVRVVEAASADQWWLRCRCGITVYRERYDDDIPPPPRRPRGLAAAMFALALGRSTAP